MNDPSNPSPQPAEDSELEGLLSPLKGLEPPLESRVANRQAVAAALSSEDRWAEPIARQSSRQPWWRRTVAVPVPLALGLAVLMALTLFSSIQGWRPRPVKAPVDQRDIAANPINDKNAAPKTIASSSATVRFSESETYLCGIGRISGETTYVFKD
jgi:hypothetical protein